MAGVKATIKTPFESNLYIPKETKILKSELETQKIEINLDSFYHQFFVDEEVLKNNIKKLLVHKPQCTMTDIHKEFGIQKGVAELIGYLSIAKNSNNARVEDDEKIELKIKDFDGNIKTVSMPKIVFVK